MLQVFSLMRYLWAYPFKTLETVVVESPVRCAMVVSVSFFMILRQVCDCKCMKKKWIFKIFPTYTNKYNDYYTDIHYRYQILKINSLHDTISTVK